MANELRADAIIVFTLRGYMSRHCAWMRPLYSPIYAFCEDQDIANSLSLSWGVTGIVMPFDHSVPEQTTARALQRLKSEGRLVKGNTIVIITSVSAGPANADAVQMRVID